MNVYTSWIQAQSDSVRKNAPGVLYLEGDEALLLGGKRVAVIGTRSPSYLGIARTQAVVQLLVDLGMTVVSGLAQGVDTVAHETALALNGRTVAVLPTPLSKCTPSDNRDLLERIKRSHLAVSEFPEGSSVFKGNFIRRNKTMALLSDAVVVVEATASSGTQSAVREALRLNKPVFILESLAQNPDVPWVADVLRQGAEVLTREGARGRLERLNPVG